MQDLNGRAYATVAATKAGDKIQADGDFTCIREGAIVEVREDKDGIYVACKDGRHYLDSHFVTEKVEPFYLGFYPAAN